MQQQSTTKVVIKTAVITVAALLVACLMIAVVVFFCFPYSGYKFSSDLGLKRTALFFAEQYADKGNIDGLVYCVELDGELLNSTGKQKYANKMIDHTQEFYGYESAYEYFARLDKYYVNNSPAQSRVGLFSYNEYLVSSNYLARAVVGSDEKMLFRGEPTDLDNIFTEDITQMEKATVYCALAKAMGGGKMDFALMVDGGAFTSFYYDVHGSIAQYIVQLEQSTDTLQTLFLMRSVIYLINEVSDYFAASQVDVSEQWQGFLTYEYNGVSISDAYTDMYLQYIITND